MNQMELEYILRKNNIALTSIDPTLCKVRVLLSDNRRFQLVIKETILALTEEQLIKKINTLTQQSKITITPKRQTILLNKKSKKR